MLSVKFLWSHPSLTTVAVTVSSFLGCGRSFVCGLLFGLQKSIKQEGCRKYPYVFAYHEDTSETNCQDRQSSFTAGLTCAENNDVKQSARKLFFDACSYKWNSLVQRVHGTRPSSSKDVQCRTNRCSQGRACRSVLFCTSLWNGPGPSLLERKIGE